VLIAVVNPISPETFEMYSKWLEQRLLGRTQQTSKEVGVELPLIV